MQPPLAFTCGDPSGVGPEIIAAWIARHPMQANGVVPIGPSRWIESLGLGGISVGPENFCSTPGVPSVEGARVAFEALEEAARGCREGRFSAVVTGPVSKEWMAKAGFPYPGQTEFFAARWGGILQWPLPAGALPWHWPLGIFR